MFCIVCQIFTTQVLCSGEKLFLFIIFVTGDRMSVSSTASTSLLPDMLSLKQLNEGKLQSDILFLRVTRKLRDAEIFFTV